MAFLRKVKAGLVKREFETFVGEDGNLFYNIETGELRISDGATVGGIAAVGLSSLRIGLSDSNNNLTTVVPGINELRFDIDSGFDLTDLGGGTVKIGMNSTFKTWKVDGQQDLVAQGLDTVEFKAGSGIVLTTDPSGGLHKSLTIKTVDKTVKLYQDGILSPTVGSVRWHNPSPIKISKITARLADAPATDLTVKVNKTGTLSETLTLPTSATKVVETVDIDMFEDDYLTVDIDFDSQNSGGSGLSVEFTYSFL